MAKKRGKGGFFDNLFNNPFGGIFDFDGDGKEDFAEQFLGFKMLEEAEKEDEEIDIDDPNLTFEEQQFLDEMLYGWHDKCEDGSKYGIYPENYVTLYDYNEALNEAKYGWRRYVQPSFELNIDPEDYETEEEYNEALNEAKYGWRDYVEENLELNIYPEDYETEEEYLDALEEAERDRDYYGETADNNDNEHGCFDCPSDLKSFLPMNISIPVKVSIERSDSEYDNRFQFIEKHKEVLIAAKYLTKDGDFLYSQAIKDNFELPVTLPDENNQSELSFEKIINKIARKNEVLALDVWAWCIEHFLPYSDYAPYSRGKMTNELINSFFKFSDNFKKTLGQYLEEHNDFRKNLIINADKIPTYLAEFLVLLIKNNYNNTARAMFEDAIQKSDGSWKEINHLTDSLISSSKNYDELETIEFIESELLPQVKKYPDGMIQDEIEFWEKDIADYKQEVEKECKKYAYTRSNAWRKTVPNGEKYGLDPCDYDNQQEYLNAIQEKKYSWRKYCKHQETLGLDVNDFETEQEYRTAWKEKRQAMLKQKQEELKKQRSAEMKLREKEISEDKTIYTYCGVKLPVSSRPYSFRTDDTTISVSDTVIVPLGKENRETEGTVVSVGQYARLAVPYPPERTKFILRKVKKENDL